MKATTPGTRSRFLGDVMRVNACTRRRTLEGAVRIHELYVTNELSGKSQEHTRTWGDASWVVYPRRRSKEWVEPRGVVAASTAGGSQPTCKGPHTRTWDVAFNPSLPSYSEAVVAAALQCHLRIDIAPPPNRGPKSS